MEIELLRARAKMAQDQLLRLEQHHGKWCDGVQGAFHSMQELCDELLKLRAVPSAVASSSLGSPSLARPSPQHFAQEVSLVPGHGSVEAAPDLFRGTFAVRPTLQPRVPLDEELTMPRPKSIDASSSRTSSKGYRSWEMEYTMGHDAESVIGVASEDSMKGSESGTSLLNLQYDPPKTDKDVAPPLDEKGESREVSVSGQGESSLDTEGVRSKLFRQLSPSLYGGSGSPSWSEAITHGISTLLPMDEDLRHQSTLTALKTDGRLRKHLDQAAGLLVTLNFFFMCWELEWEGHNLGAEMGIPGLQPHPLLAIRWTEMVFSFLFLIELLLRVYADRWEFLHQFANWFDTALVLNSLADMYIFFATLFGSPPSYVSETVFRAIATLRTIRIMRAMRLFRGLRLLLKACHAFLPTLAWSMVLLGVIMSMSGLLVGRLLQYFIAEEQEELEDRIWVWKRYGTAYRSIYTLYEITFAGNWPSNVRPILEKVSHTFVIFFLFYITVVVFAAIRAITAVFLKDTLDAAHNDAEHQLAEGLKKKAQYVSKLENFFQQIDHGGNGMITEERLNAMLENPRVKAYFETLDLAVHEGTALFHILDNGDGEVTLEEFIDGILRCKGPARAIDQVAMQADLKDWIKRSACSYPGCRKEK